MRKYEKFSTQPTGLAVERLLMKTKRTGDRYLNEEFRKLKNKPEALLRYVMYCDLKGSDIEEWMVETACSSPYTSFELIMSGRSCHKALIQKISENDYFSYSFATKVLKNRFIEGEPIILASEQYRVKYINFLKTLKNE